MTKRQTLSSPFLPDNCASDPADSLVLLRRSLGLHGRSFGAGRLVSVLAFATSLLGAATRQLLGLEQGQGRTTLVSFLAAVLLLSVAMVARCASSWHGGVRGAWQVVDNVRS